MLQLGEIIVGLYVLIILLFHLIYIIINIHGDYFEVEWLTVDQLLPGTQWHCVIFYAPAGSRAAVAIAAVFCYLEADFRWHHILDTAK